MAFDDEHNPESSEPDFEMELQKDLKKDLQFFLKELEIQTEQHHLDAILGEIIYLESICQDIKTKAYINRKLKEITVHNPNLKL